MFASRIGQGVGSGLVAVMLLHVLPPPATAQEAAHGAASRALEICRRVPELPADERSARLAEGLALAEAAIAERPDDAVAYFAAFCNRGRRLELEGLSLYVFAEVRRLRAHIERTLELAPDWSDAIAGKGGLLVSLPGPLGGDRTEGQRPLRRALALDPANFEARRLLEQSGASVAGEVEQVRTATTAR